MTQHTPAPWTIFKAKYPDNTGGLDIAIDHDGHIIAEVFQHTGFKDEEQKEFFIQPVEANARLIAAAPELLEALENIFLGTGMTGENMDKARAAIAKARGQ